MKHIKIFFPILLILIIVSCSNEPGDGGSIKLKDTPKEMTVTADQSEVNNGRGISFTAEGPWAAIATTQPPTYSRSSGLVDWIDITPSSGDAGTYTIQVTLSVNDTGNDRTAYIVITCEGTDIIIKITQLSTDANGQTPTPFDPSHTEMRQVHSITYDEETPYDYEGVYAVDFNYDVKGRIAEMICHSKGWGDDSNYTNILKVDYSIAGELRLINDENGTWIITLDPQGRATKATCRRSQEEYTFSYNKLGRLEKVSFSDSDEEYIQTISYTDGLMTGFEQIEDGDIFFKENYDVNKLYPNGLMNYASNYDFNAFMLFDMWRFGEEIVVPLYFMRYLGNTVDCLYMQINLDDDEEPKGGCIGSYYEPNRTFEESYTSHIYGLTTDAKYTFDGNSPTQISWNKPYTMTKVTYTVTTGSKLINPDEPRLGYQYTVSNRKEQTADFGGLHRYTITYK